MATDVGQFSRSGEALSLSARPPSRSVIESLAAEDQVLLTQILTDGVDYIDNPCLAERGACKELFGAKAELVSPKATRFVPHAPVASDRKRNGLGVPILSTEQERLIFLQLNYVRRQISLILNGAVGRRLTSAETRLLLAWGHRALLVRSQIVKFNVPLVLAMAKRTRLSGIDYNELISEGNLALLRSAEKFDCGRGFKFSTYACRAILKSFSRVAMRASRYRNRFPVEFEPAMERSDFVERKRVDTELDCVDELKRILVQNTADLNTVEQRVITERFALVRTGLPEAGPKTLEEVGVIIGVTKERVRQIQNKALQKIRATLETEYLVA